MKYPKLKEGEGVTLDLDNDELHLACCDCGLVHILQFHKIKKNIWDLVMFRNNRATGQLRRNDYGNLYPEKK